MKTSLALCTILALFCTGSGMPSAQSLQVPTISLDSPSRLHTGDILRISVTGIQQGTVIIGTSMFSFLSDVPVQAIITKPPYEFTFMLPPEIPAGDYVFNAFLRNLSTTLTSNAVFVHVSSGSPVSKLLPDPSGFILRFAGAAKDVRVYGSILKGQEDLTNDGVTSCRSGNTQIVTVAPPCTVVAVDSGVTTVVVSRNDLRTSVPVHVQISATRGDFNGDGSVDQYDLESLTNQINKPLASPRDARDLNGDGKIDALDARIEATLCTHPRCAVQ